MLTSQEFSRIFIIGAVVIIFASVANLFAVDSLYLPPSTELSFQLDVPNAIACESDSSLLGDIIIPQNTKRKIPRQIHIVVQNRCLAKEVDERLRRWYLDGYSVVIHDNNAADALLSIHRPEFPQLQALTKCISQASYKTELVKLLLLWDKGGVVFDENRAPGRSLENIIKENDEGILLLKGGDDQKFYLSEYMAVMPNHPIIYALIQKTLGDIFMQVTDEKFIPMSNAKRKSGYFDFVMKYIFMDVIDIQADNRSIHQGMGRNVTIVNITAMGEESYLMNASLPLIVDELIISSKEISADSCVDWNKKYDNHNDILSSLQGLVGSSSGAQCPDGQFTIQDIIKPQRMYSKRNIPKIVHMTSKTRCMPKDFADNVNSWQFDEYSFFLHDDNAVAKLLSREWPEFPLLHDVINCITSGAGFADLWRYLVLWEYGGIYTDIDNAPGPLLENATIITDDMDSFLEVEAARFPSQYFISASPRHPAMYMAVQVTIQRLLNEQNIVKQYVPYVTGPGAFKWGVHFAIGQAYVNHGETWDTFLTSRSMTFVGNRTTAMRRNYILRGNASTKDHYDGMNMTHYHWAGRQKGLPLKACIEVLYDMKIHGNYSNLLGLHRLR